VEALHDFRVALRRLRSWIRAYGDDLADSVGRGARRSLRALARVTSESRDLEVHLAWLMQVRDSVTERQRPGVEWLAWRLRADQERADAAFRTHVESEFGPLSARLRKGLARHAVSAWVYGESDRWAMVAAARVQDAFTALRRRLAAIEDVDDDRRQHRARIAGKRLRYLLEPLLDVADGAGEAVERLKTLQDLLGSQHDAHVFAREVRRAARAAHHERATGAAEGESAGDPRPGLRAVAQRLEKRRQKAWTDFNGEWMERDFDLVADRIHTVLLSLREHSGQGLEIERKYLLRRVPAEVRRASAAEIDQGYLPGTKLVERLRRVRGPDGVRYFRTVKLGDGPIRTEVEEETTRAIYAAMWPLTKGRRLRKTRYTLADSGRVWEIDRFLDRRLILAEVELASAKDDVALPEWLAKVTEREVTGEADYLNVNLAR
jgi:CHAD domain-containing protein/CYTH domain-containing protein